MWIGGLTASDLDYIWEREPCGVDRSQSAEPDLAAVPTPTMGEA